MTRRLLAAFALAWTIVCLALPPCAFSWTSSAGTDGTNGTSGTPMLDADTDKLYCSQAARGATLSLPNATGALDACSSNTIVATDIGQTATGSGVIPVTPAGGTLNDWVSPATQSAPGLMSAADKAKSDGIIYPHGWPLDVNGNRLVTTYYDPATRTVTIHTGTATTTSTATTTATFAVWNKGIPRTEVDGFTSAAHAATEGPWFYYWDGSNWTWSQTFWNLFAHSPTTYVYWSSVGSTGAGYSELHGWNRDIGWHVQQHMTAGTMLISGGVLSGYTLNTSTDAAVKFGISDTTIMDEDLPVTAAAFAYGGTYTIWRRSGANGYWTWSTGNSLPFLYGTYPQRNLFTADSWSMADITGTGSGNFGTYYVVATPGIDQANQRYILIPGQSDYATLAAAQAETMSGLALGTLPFAEFVPIAQLVFQAKSSFGGTAKTQLVSVSRLTGARASVSSPASASNHNALTGLQGGAANAYYHLDLPASATPTAGTAPIAGTGAKLDMNWLPPQVTVASSLTAGRLSKAVGANAVGNSSASEALTMGAFTGLSQTSRVWSGLAYHSDGSIYACAQSGNIYKQTGGTGDFVSLGQATRNWNGIAVAPNGDVYATVYNGSIYKQTGGTGSFVSLGETTRNWNGIAVAPNGNVYAVAENGSIYKQAGGTGSFVDVGPGGTGWYAIEAAPNGDVYATVYTGSIYKQTGGTGSFVSLAQTNREWSGIAVAPNGDVYATVYNGSIYKQTGGTGSFVSLGETTRNWNGIAVAPNGNVYAAVVNGDIYKSTVSSTAVTFASTIAAQNISATPTASYIPQAGTDAKLDMNWLPNQTTFNPGLTAGKLTKSIGINSVGDSSASEALTMSAFAGLGQASRRWRGITVAPNGDVYSTTLGADIFKQTGGTGTFVGLGQGNRNWSGIAAAPNGDVYATWFGNGVFKQTGGTGNFTLTSETARSYYDLTVAPNGDVYLVVDGGDIWLMPKGIGPAVALGQTSRRWLGIAASPNGDIYASTVVNGSVGNIYKRTRGIGSFTSIGVPGQWGGMAVSPSGDVYAITAAGGGVGDKIYKQIAGSGSFVEIWASTVSLVGISFSKTNNSAIVSSDSGGLVGSGDIYQSTVASTAVTFASTIAAQNISATPTASYIPQAKTDSKLDIGWLPTGTATNLIVTGADSRLTDARTPTGSMAATGPVRLQAGTATATASSVALASTPTVSIDTGTGTSQVITGADSRLTNARASTDTVYATSGVVLTTGTSTVTATSGVLSDGVTFSGQNLAPLTDTRFGVWAGSSTLTNYIPWTATGTGTSQVVTGADPRLPPKTLNGTNGIAYVGTTTVTSTVTGTGTISGTASGTATVAASFSGSGSNTASGTMTATATRTAELSGNTGTGTLSMSATYTTTNVRTATFVLTSQIFATFTNTATVTSLVTATAAGFATATHTLTNTAQGTGPSTGSGTGNDTITGTVSTTLTASATGTGSALSTATATVTSTSTVTLTASQVVTGTYVKTDTFSNTGTYTITVTLTQTGTATLTASPTFNGTVTGTGVATATPGVPMTITSSATDTAFGTGSGTWTNTELGTFTTTSLSTSATIVETPDYLAPPKANAVYADVGNSRKVSDSQHVHPLSDVPGNNYFLNMYDNEGDGYTTISRAPYPSDSAISADWVSTPTVGSPQDFHGPGSLTTYAHVLVTAETARPLWIAPGNIELYLWAKSTEASGQVLWVFGECAGTSMTGSTFFTGTTFVLNSDWRLLRNTIAVPDGFLVGAGNSLCFTATGNASSGAPTITLGASGNRYSRINVPAGQTGPVYPRTVYDLTTLSIQQAVTEAGVTATYGAGWATITSLNINATATPAYVMIHGNASMQGSAATTGCTTRLVVDSTQTGATTAETTGTINHYSSHAPSAFSFVSPGEHTIAIQAQVSATGTCITPSGYGSLIVTLMGPQ